MGGDEGFSAERILENAPFGCCSGHPPRRTTPKPKPILMNARGTLLKIYLQPRAKKNEIKGFHGEELKITLNTPPIDNRANEALIEFLSDVFQIPKRQISIQSGHRSRHKTILFSGISESEFPFAKAVPNR